MMPKLKNIICVAAMLVACHAPSVLACAACYGKSDSKLAEGMNWGIFSLLGMVVFVLASIASFFVFLAWKAAAVAGVDVDSAASPKKI
jgi:hypothetical protein